MNIENMATIRDKDTKWLVELVDGTFSNVPKDPANKDHQLILKLIEKGVNVEPYVEIAPDYGQLRLAGYPPLSELADALVHKEAGNRDPYDTYITACLVVKAKYPKESELVDFNTSTKKYHVPGCHHCDEDQNLVDKNALPADAKPCGTCNP